MEVLIEKIYLCGDVSQNEDWLDTLVPFEYKCWPPLPCRHQDTSWNENHKVETEAMQSFRLWSGQDCGNIVLRSYLFDLSDHIQSEMRALNRPSITLGRIIGPFWICNASIRYAHITIAWRHCIRSLWNILLTKVMVMMMMLMMILTKILVWPSWPGWAVKPGTRSPTLRGWGSKSH